MCIVEAIVKHVFYHTCSKFGWKKKAGKLLREDKHMIYGKLNISGI
jgi:hypothetical protein